jgi:hypothetical protein
VTDIFCKEQPKWQIKFEKTIFDLPFSQSWQIKFQFFSKMADLIPAFFQKWQIFSQILQFDLPTAPGCPALSCTPARSQPAPICVIMIAKKQGRL